MRPYMPEDAGKFSGTRKGTEQVLWDIMRELHHDVFPYLATRDFNALLCLALQTSYVQRLLVRVMQRAITPPSHRGTMLVDARGRI